MTIIDLDRVDREGPSGAVWSLEESDDLNANLVVLAPGDKVGEHVNAEVDVLIVVLDGEGVLVADGVVWRLAPHVSVLVPRGAARQITAARADDERLDQPLRYLTVHRRRGPLQVGSKRKDASASAGANRATRAIVDRRPPIVMPTDDTHAGATGAPPPGCPAHQPGVGG